ncbi:helix-turn-helix transcriptional regulator [Pararhodobacter zhoushanensis]|uniref:helix-turn-helix transcriptional regulator n=1 Tax=Pararhodobacter zhoushanensis TaxID=2479545 RepID=UPI000F8D86E6|nr:YafY family protein [Pararhodobacter zhoushanensis]
MRRADRLIKIVHFLRGRRRAVTARQIADEFEICTRTVYRDIQDLVGSGAPITGEAGVGYLIDKQYYLPPVTFDADELEALGLGISMVRHWTDQRLADKAESAFAKIQAVLPAILQGELEQITTYSIPDQPALPWTISFSDLRESIRAQRKIDIRYTDEAGQQTSRTLRPLALIFCSPVWLLAAWCEQREDFRNFRLDRMQSMTVSATRFAHESDKNLTAYKAQDGVC